MLPTLFGEKGQREHEYLYWEFHENGGKTAVRTGNWKGIRLNVGKDPEGSIELYDLSTDIHEDRNVADEHPEIVREMPRSCVRPAFPPRCSTSVRRTERCRFRRDY